MMLCNEVLLCENGVGSMGNSNNITNLIHEEENVSLKNDESIIVESKREVFARGICYSKLFWLFIIGCVIGTYYEQILTLVRLNSWESRQGVIYGPFNPVYGFGMVLFIVILYKFKEWWKVFLIGAFIGGGFEYILSYLQEVFINSTSWDYSKHFLNINGRTTIPFMIFWGLLAVGVMKYVFPFFDGLIEKVPIKVGNITTVVFSLFMLFNMIITGMVLLRQAQRHKEIKPYTYVGQLIDEIYTDEYLEKLFPNMTKYD